MAIRTLRSGASAIPENDVLQFITDMVTTSGVLDSSGTQLQVSAGTGLAVSIAAGRAYLTATGGNAYPVIMDAAYSNLALASNTSGNPRIDAVVLYLNLGATSNPDASNVGAIMIVEGTPAGSPSAPSSATIQAAVGTSNPWIQLATVDVASGASAPGTITDTRGNAVFLWGVSLPLSSVFASYQNSSALLPPAQVISLPTSGGIGGLVNVGSPIGFTSHGGNFLVKISGLVVSTNGYYCRLSYTLDSDARVDLFRSNTQTAVSESFLLAGLSAGGHSLQFSFVQDGGPANPTGTLTATQDVNCLIVEI